jgi:hypothetical protein
VLKTTLHRADDDAPPCRRRRSTVPTTTLTVLTTTLHRADDEIISLGRNHLGMDVVGAVIAAMMRGRASRHIR